MELHALTQVACSYVLLTLVTVYDLFASISKLASKKNLRCTFFLGISVGEERKATNFFSVNRYFNWD